MDRCRHLVRAHGSRQRRALVQDRLPAAGACWVLIPLRPLNLITRSARVLAKTGSSLRDIQELPGYRALGMTERFCCSLVLA